ncbi:hypothetical protein ABT187_48690 [Streptomyces sp. NPDC001817]|uniref:hypothetical protein n=1 Tax=Streptomyces sp. NPDC001817 TaxID=3154398 RepID=UPI00332435EE
MQFLNRFVYRESSALFFQQEAEPAPRNSKKGRCMIPFKRNIATIVTAALLTSGILILASFAIHDAIRAPSPSAAMPGRLFQEMDLSELNTKEADNGCSTSGNTLGASGAISTDGLCTSDVSDPVSAKTVRVSWVPASTGPAATSYRVIATYPCASAGICSNTYFPAANATSIVVPVNGSPTTYTVIPQNEAGAGPSSPSSSPVINSEVPISPAAPTVTPVT